MTNPIQTGILLLTLFWNSGNLSQASWTIPASLSTHPPALQTPSERLAQPSLKPADLPARFQPAPAFIQKFVSNGVSGASQDLQREGITVDQISTFIDFKDAVLVIAITITLADQQAIGKYDSGLQKPEVQEIFSKGLQRSLSNLGQVKVTAVREITPLLGIGNFAKGFAMEAAVEGLPLNLSAEAIAFRREHKGGMVILGSLNHSMQGISAQELALRLDQRLQERNSSCPNQC